MEQKCNMYPAEIAVERLRQFNRATAMMEDASAVEKVRSGGKDMMVRNDVIIINHDFLMRWLAMNCFHGRVTLKNIGEYITMGAKMKHYLSKTTNCNNCNKRYQCSYAIPGELIVLNCPMAREE